MKLKNYFKDCFKIIKIITNTLLYGTWKDRIQIVKDAINCESWLYE